MKNIDSTYITALKGIFSGRSTSFSSGHCPDHVEIHITILKIWSINHYNVISTVIVISYLPCKKLFFCNIDIINLMQAQSLFL